jgi:hypothetical protein
MTMSRLEIDIDPATLGDTPVHPPRRRLLDFLPGFIKTPIRKRFDRLKATPREVWVLRSLYLRIFYNAQRLNEAIDKVPKPFILAKTEDPDKPKDDPWRWS